MENEFKKLTTYKEYYVEKQKQIVEKTKRDIERFIKSNRFPKKVFRGVKLQIKHRYGHIGEIQVQAHSGFTADCFYSIFMTYGNQSLGETKIFCLRSKNFKCTEYRPSEMRNFIKDVITKRLNEMGVEFDLNDNECDKVFKLKI